MNDRAAINGFEQRSAKQEQQARPSLMIGYVIEGADTENPTCGVSLMSAAGG